MAQQQLAIINQDTKESFVYGKDTVQIHAIPMLDGGAFGKGVYPSKDFSLLEDASIKCRPRLIYDKERVGACFYLEIEFTTPVPKVNKYEISLYYFDKLGQLKFDNVLIAKNIRQGDKFRLSCSGAFSGNQKYKYIDSLVALSANNIDATTIMCSKISRIDSSYVLQQKPALHSSQITDCSLLFENTALSNLTISVENREFKVHKEILAAKSSVFLAMFETAMKEKRENHVKIDDIEANVFQELLRYMYTNKVNDLNTHAQKLYKAADKYDLSNLKLICVDKLSRSLNVENAVDLLSFADENNETTLREITMHFIKQHIKLIFQTDSYKALYQSPKAYLIHEIFRATVEYFDATIDYLNTLK